MKRAGSILTAAAAGLILVSAPVHASEEVSASRILSKVYASLGMDDEMSDVEPSRNGIFFGVHSNVGPDSGLIPVASGFSSPLLFDRGAEDSITANGYYVYQTNFSLGTYVGGGFGRFNLVDNALLNPSGPRGTYGVQGMAGLTFAFSPSMVLGLEYRYSETMPNSAAVPTTAPNAQQDESVTLRFDFLLN
jgi:opacity protein-like surface antigen